MKAEFLTRVVFTSGRFFDVECNSEKVNLVNTGLFRKLLRNGYAMGLIKSYYTIN